MVNSGECPVRRIGLKNCSPTANSTDIFYISFVYYLFMCRSACWRPRISLAQKAEQQRITNTKACWYPCCDSEAPNDGNRGSGRVRTRLGFTPAERALPCSGHCDFLRRNAALCITFLHRCLSMLNFVIPFGKERYT